MDPQSKAILNPSARYATLSDFTPEWIAQVRGVIQRDDLKVRAGFPACIEIKGPNGWQPLMLPTNGIEFTGRKDRDAVLEMLRQPEPNDQAHLSAPGGRVERNQKEQ